MFFLWPVAIERLKAEITEHANVTGANARKPIRTGPMLASLHPRPGGQTPIDPHQLGHHLVGPLGDLPTIVIERDQFQIASIDRPFGDVVGSKGVATEGGRLVLWEIRRFAKVEPDPGAGPYLYINMSRSCQRRARSTSRMTSCTSAGLLLCSKLPVSLVAGLSSPLA